jgi:hypothetical protein
MSGGNGAATKAVAKATAPTTLSQSNPIELADHFVKSGYFKDANDLSKAVVKIVAGEELGLGPMASMSGIHIIDGKPSMSANLLAAQVKRHPAYNYRPIEVSDQGAKIEFFEHGKSIGVSEFTLADAQRAGIAGKQNYKRYPKAMNFARALSQGVRWYCPDVTAGSPAYVPEELGAEVDAEGVPQQANGVTEIDSATAADIERERAAAPAEEEVSDAEVVHELNREQVEKLAGGIAALKLSYRGVNLLLAGPVGADALSENTVEGITTALRALTLDQATRMEAELERLAQDADATAPQEAS